MRAKTPALPAPEPSAYSVPGVPEAVCEWIGKQRDIIGNALCVLQCISLAIGASEGEDPFQGPFFPPAVDAVVDMLADAHEGLDPGVIKEHLTTPSRR